MNLVLIRHSKTIINSNVSFLLWTLSHEGVGAAMGLSEEDTIKTLDVIYTSFQTKALETAVILAKNNYISIKCDNDLTESTSITNGFIKDYSETIKNYYEGNIERINEGETIVEAQYRFNACIEKIIANEPNAKNIGIISHCNVLSVFSSQFCDKTPYQLHDIIRMPDYAILNWDTKQFTKFYSA